MQIRKSKQANTSKICDMLFATMLPKNVARKEAHRIKLQERDHHMVVNLLRHLGGVMMGNKPRDSLAHDFLNKVNNRGGNDLFGQTCNIIRSPLPTSHGAQFLKFPQNIGGRLWFTFSIQTSTTWRSFGEPCKIKKTQKPVPFSSGQI